VRNKKTILTVPWGC